MLANCGANTGLALFCFQLYYYVDKLKYSAEYTVCLFTTQAS